MLIPADNFPAHRAGHHAACQWVFKTGGVSEPRYTLQEIVAVFSFPSAAFDIRSFTWTPRPLSDGGETGAHAVCAAGASAPSPTTHTHTHTLQPQATMHRYLSLLFLLPVMKVFSRSEPECGITNGSLARRGYGPDRRGVQVSVPLNLPPSHLLPAGV